MDDITEEIDGFVAPSDSHIEQVLNFVRGWDRSAPLVVHCYAGISRSTASAFAAACMLNPHRDEISIARQIRAASPIASPNRLIVSLADKALGREGRMLRALDEMGPAACWSKAARSASISSDALERQMSQRPLGCRAALSWKYRPVFELLSPEFTLTELRRTVEAISGAASAQAEFRRLVETGALVEPTGAMSTQTGGRPAALFRFRREVLQEPPAPVLRVLGRR